MPGVVLNVEADPGHGQPEGEGERGGLPPSRRPKCQERVGAGEPAEHHCSLDVHAGRLVRHAASNGEMKVHLPPQLSVERAVREVAGIRAGRQGREFPRGSVSGRDPPTRQTRSHLYRTIASLQHPTWGRGVKFTQTPKKMPSGTFAQFVDPDVNEFILMEE